MWLWNGGQKSGRWTSEKKGGGGTDGKKDDDGIRELDGTNSTPHRIGVLSVAWGSEVTARIAARGLMHTTPAPLHTKNTGTAEENGWQQQLILPEEPQFLP